ncbi:hypothetical protein EUGRSUZ_F00652 [Eucalyptus grandis]|uniref:Uncharacterized protein n=2 Tax=Eucalyptus grandis TaxID=71139 RepID=A0A059BMI5_EUCGR|nr:hypothetical protein EUGRSUZ_F00652 [Eucalyptus grandis]
MLILVSALLQCFRRKANHTEADQTWPNEQNTARHRNRMHQVNTDINLVCTKPAIHRKIHGRSSTFIAE